MEKSMVVVYSYWPDLLFYKYRISLNKRPPPPQITP